MYLHLGQDFIVNTRDVIGVFDLDTATDAGQKAKITDEFLRHAQQEGAVVDVSGSMPKSFVLTDFPDDTVYITQISTAAIRNRAAKFDKAPPDIPKGRFYPDNGRNAGLSF